MSSVPLRETSVCDNSGAAHLRSNADGCAEDSFTATHVAASSYYAGALYGEGSAQAYQAGPPASSTGPYNLGPAQGASPVTNSESLPGLTPAGLMRQREESFVHRWAATCCKVHASASACNAGLLSGVSLSTL
jgi:hypothetical protein